MNERTKDGANVPENRKWSDQDHRWEYEAQGLLEPEKLADGQDGPEDQAQTIAALTQEVATLKAELAHWNDSKRCLHESMNEVDPENFDDCSNEQLKEATEYSERCNCFVCCWTRFELARRAALATLRSENERLKQPVSDKEWLLNSARKAEYGARATRHQVNALIQSRITPPKDK